MYGLVKLAYYYNAKGEQQIEGADPAWDRLNEESGQAHEKADELYNQKNQALKKDTLSGLLGGGLVGGLAGGLGAGALGHYTGGGKEDAMLLGLVGLGAGAFGGGLVGGAHRQRTFEKRHPELMNQYNQAFNKADRAANRLFDYQDTHGYEVD